MVARMTFVASRRANSPSSRSREHGDLQSTPTKATIASVQRESLPPLRPSAVASRVLRRQEFDSAARRRVRSGSGFTHRVRSWGSWSSATTR
jgi:hypothetical protein